MTLVNRVSVFFLAALGVCLGGYSLLLYLFIRGHLYREFDEPLQRVLHVVAAAVEVEPDDVKWQPADHAASLDSLQDADSVRWMLTGDDREIVDHSQSLAPKSKAGAALLARMLASPEGDIANWDVDGWRFRKRRLAAPAPKPNADREEGDFEALTVTVARNTEELESDLFRLGAAVVVLPLLLWGAAFAAGRGYCRRALSPVSDMARHARSPDTPDFRLRLPGANREDELGDLASAFNGLLSQLESAFDRQQRFAGDAAHQLRTPLTALRGEVEVALRRPRSEAEHREILDRLHRQTVDLQQIVESLLFLARAEGDGTPPGLSDIDIAQWMAECLIRWKGHPREADLAVRVTAVGSLRGSRSLLRQAVDNLIDNAFKYSPPGRPVVVEAAGDEEEIRISVTDQGCGIPPGEVTSIFEPFFRSADSRRDGIAGTGLGLPIVARIATLHGGSVECQSAPGEGSRFRLTLPRQTS